MIWKFLLFLVGMVLLIAFAWVNYDNVADISFGFYNFREIPVFISVFVSFVVGALFAIPFAFFGKKKKPTSEMKVSKKPSDANYFDHDSGANEKKKLTRPSVFKRKEKKQPSELITEPVKQESVFDTDKL